MIRGVIVEPKNSAAKPQLILFVFTGEEIDEFGSAGLDRAAALFVLGNDHVAQCDERGVLRGGKIFWSVFPCRRGCFFFAHHLVDVFGGFCRNDLEYGASGGAHSERAENVATRDGFVRHGIHRKEKDLTPRPQRTQRKKGKRRSRDSLGMTRQPDGQKGEALARNAC